MNLEKIEKTINEAFEKKDKIDSSDKTLNDLVRETIDLLDNGKIRVAEKKGDKWQVNQWIKKAILLSFRVNKMKASIGPYSTWYDKVDGKTQGWSEEQVKKAIFNNLKRRADWETNRSKPVNVQKMADGAQTELNKKIASTF